MQLPRGICLCNFMFYFRNRTQFFKFFICYISGQNEHCLTFCLKNVFFFNQTDLQFARQRKTSRIIYISNTKIRVLTYKNDVFEKSISLLAYRWCFKLKSFYLKKTEFNPVIQYANNCFNPNDLWFSERKTSFASSSLVNNLRLENTEKLLRQA